jgi:predicted DCC family thiol-disulfide oxidoreductase YuxK
VSGVLLFDGDCSFCTWTATWAERRLPPGNRVEAWQLAGDLSRYELTEAQVARAAYWIDDEGRAHRGHLAVAETWRAIGGLWHVLGTAIRVPPLSWPAAGVYAFVARIRHRLPGSTPACQAPRGSRSGQQDPST